MRAFGSNLYNVEKLKNLLLQAPWACKATQPMWNQDFRWMDQATISLGSFLDLFALISLGSFPDLFALIQNQPHVAELFAVTA